MATTTHHLRCFLARHPGLGLDEGWLAERLRARGARVLESRRRGEEAVPELVERTLRPAWAHRFAPELARAHPEDPGVRAWLARAVHTARRAPSPDAADDPRLAPLLAALAADLREGAAGAAPRPYSASALSSGS